MKKFARVTAATLLKLTLFGAAIAASSVAVFGSPTPIKQAIDESNLYDNIVETVFTEAQKKFEGDTRGENPAAQAVPALEQAAKASFTPDVLKSSSEQIIDGVYRWLNGDVDSPDFRVDLTQVKQQFIASAGAAAESHANSLPACTTEQLENLDPETDVFSLPCRPPQLNPAQARDEAIAQLQNSDFLKDPVLTASSLSKNEEGQTFFEQIEGAQAGFSLMKSLWWVLLVMSALLGVAVFFLNETRRQGIKNLSTTLLGTGVFLLIGTWLVSFTFDQAAKPTGFLGKNAGNELQEGLLRLARSLNGSFNRTLLIFCVVYILLGGIGLIVLYFTKPKTSEAEKPSDKPDKPKTEENQVADSSSLEKLEEPSRTTKKTASKL